MLPTTQPSSNAPSRRVSTAEAFYRVFCALSKKDRLVIARYILEDAEIRQHLEGVEIPNATTLEAFGEDPATMPVFHTIDDLRKDLLA